MERIDVTDEQYEQLDAIRASLAEGVSYGHVRPQDAVQYLLDEHDGADPDVTAASAGPDAAAADADSEDATGDDAEDESEAEDAEGDGSGDDADAGGDGDGDDKLSAMMNLLDTHDDKWERADSEETRYVVDLPDGGTEEVQTKDDVKAILFKNY